MWSAQLKINQLYRASSLSSSVDDLEKRMPLFSKLTDELLQSCEVILNRDGNTLFPSTFPDTVNVEVSDESLQKVQQIVKAALDWVRQYIIPVTCTSCYRGLGRQAAMALPQEKRFGIMTSEMFVSLSEDIKDGLETATKIYEEFNVSYKNALKLEICMQRSVPDIAPNNTDTSDLVYRPLGIDPKENYANQITQLWKQVAKTARELSFVLPPAIIRVIYSRTRSSTIITEIDDLGKESHETTDTYPESESEDDECYRSLKASRIR